MHRRSHANADSGGSSQSCASPRAHSKTTAPAATQAGIDRYAPCPCNSGEKYKFCCGAKLPLIFGRAHGPPLQCWTRRPG